MTDKEHLEWVYQRIQRLGENPQTDFMIRFKSIIDKPPTILKVELNAYAALAKYVKSSNDMVLLAKFALFLEEHVENLNQIEIQSNIHINKSDD